MKKLTSLLSLLVTFSLLLCGTVNAQFQKDIIVTSPNGLWTDSRAYTTLQSAINAIGASERKIVIAKTEACVDLTVPSNVHLEFTRGGNINNSGQLTINTRNISAGNHQIFTGSGDIDFAGGSEIRTSWFSGLTRAFTVTEDDTISLIVSSGWDAHVTSNADIGDGVILRFDSPLNRIIVDPGVELGGVGQISALDHQIFAGAGDIDFREGSMLRLSWFERLRSIITWIESESITLEVSGSNVIDFSDTIPSNMGIEFRNGGILVLNAGVNLEINGQIIGDPQHQILDTSAGGTLTLGPKVYKWRAQWSGGFNRAISDLGSNIVEFVVSETETLTATIASIPNTLSIQFERGGRIIFGAHNITSWAAPIIGDPQHQIFDTSGGGVVSFSIGAIPIIIPEWWGAVGDGNGQTDDSVAIQSAANSLNGRTLVFSGKTYNIGTTIVLPNTSFTIEGSGGPTRTIIRESDASAPQLTLFSSTSVGPRKVITGIEFSGPQVTVGKPTGTYGGRGIDLDGNGLLVSNCWFAGMTVGVDLGGTFSNISDCTFEYCSVGIYANGSAPIEQIISHITFYKNNYDIHLSFSAATDCSSLSIHSTNHIDTHTRCIRLTNVQYAQISDMSWNPTDATAPAGAIPDFLHLAGESRYNKVNGVTVKAATVGANRHPRYGIFLEGNDVDNNIFNNVVIDGSTIGIHVSSGDYNEFSNIIVMNCPTSGIKLDASSGSRFVNSYLSGNTVGWDIDGAVPYIYNSFNANATDFSVATTTYFHGHNITGTLTGITGSGAYMIGLLTPAGNRLGYGSAAPSTGTWTAGDIIYDTAPTSGGKIGWVCVTGGTSGVWKAFGEID